MEKSFEYYAFISYKREDEKWAKWLQNKLEGYRLPSVIRKEIPRLPKRIRPIFRDKTDLGAGLLTDNLCQELEKSQYLIVICSPKSAKSEWVGKEITAFVEMGRADRIIPFIVSGSPNSNDEQECFHPIIKEKIPEALGINVNEIGKQQAFVKVTAKLLDLRFDILWNRYRRYLIRKNCIVIALIVLFLLLSSAAIFFSLTPEVFVQLKEQENHSLPFEGALVTVMYGNAKDSVSLSFADSEKDSLKTFHIPAKYTLGELRLTFHSHGYRTIDTLVPFHQNMILPLYRDDSYAYINGHVYDFKTGENISNATVIINKNSYTTATDSNGCFQYNVPLHLQQEWGNITIHKTGYEKYEEDSIHIETRRDEYAEYCLFKN